MGKILIKGAICLSKQQDISSVGLQEAIVLLFQPVRDANWQNSTFNFNSTDHQIISILPSAFPRVVLHYCTWLPFQFGIPTLFYLDIKTIHIYKSYNFSENHLEQSNLDLPALEAKIFSCPQWSKMIFALHWFLN